MGTGLLAELADRSGLTDGLSVAMGDCGISWHTHEPGVVLTHMAAAIADGADCLSKLAVLRNQQALFGPVASHATAWRAIEAVAAAEFRGIDIARASARERVWAAGGAPETVTLDFDATLLTPTPTSSVPRPPTSGGSASIPSACGATRRARPWPPCCGPATPGPTPQPTT